MPDMRRYARALAIDARDPERTADDLIQKTLACALRDERLRRGAPVRVTLYAMLTAMNRRRLRAFSEAHNADGSARPQSAEPVWQTRIEQAIARLPIDSREALLLVVLEKMSYEDAAEIIEVPMATMLARLTRGRDELRVSFNGVGAADPLVADLQSRAPSQPRVPARAHLRLVK